MNKYQEAYEELCRRDPIASMDETATEYPSQDYRQLNQLLETRRHLREQTPKRELCCDIGQNTYQLRCKDDIFSRIELFLQTSCQMKRLITRMTFNSFLSCLMSKESMEITINTSKWHECAKQWNGNSQVSSLKLTGSHFIVILFTLQCQLYI